MARRTRQHPIDFGRSSTFVETIEQPEVEAPAARFLSSLDFTGVVEVEFKHDAREGRSKLLDVNGRLWTWIGLGALAGVDFPYLAWRQALGHPSKPLPAQDRFAVDVCQPRLGRRLAGNEWRQPYGWPLSQTRSAKPLAFANFASSTPAAGAGRVSGRA